MVVVWVIVKSIASSCACLLILLLRESIPRCLELGLDDCRHLGEMVLGSFTEFEGSAIEAIPQSKMTYVKVTNLTEAKLAVLTMRR